MKKMETIDAIRAGLKELILPELDKIKEENIQIKATLELTNKRLDDINLHLIDQSRRIDEVRTELSTRIDEVRTELSTRIDEVRTELSTQIDEVRVELIGKVDETRAELKREIWKNSERIDANNLKLDKNNSRIDRLFETSIQKDIYLKLDERVGYLEKEMKEIKMKVAA